MRRTSPARLVPAVMMAAVAIACLGGCARMGRKAAATGPQPRVRLYRVSDAAQAGAEAPQAQAGVAGARNEWVSFAFQVTALPPGPWHALRLRPLRRQNAEGRGPDAPRDA